MEYSCCGTPSDDGYSKLTVDFGSNDEDKKLSWMLVQFVAFLQGANSEMIERISNAIGDAIKNREDKKRKIKVALTEEEAMFIRDRQIFDCSTCFLKHKCGNRGHVCASLTVMMRQELEKVQQKGSAVGGVFVESSNK